MRDDDAKEAAEEEEEGCREDLLKIEMAIRQTLSKRFNRTRNEFSTKSEWDDFLEQFEVFVEGLMSDDKSVEEETRRAIDELTKSGVYATKIRARCGDAGEEDASAKKK